MRPFVRYLQWAWLIEGSAQYYARGTSDFRAAVLRRLSEGDPPACPPSTREAVILGGSIFALLERERGAAACDLLVSRLPKSGPESALETAFDASLSDIEAAWRDHVTAVAESGPRS